MFASKNNNGYVSLVTALAKNFKLVFGTFAVLWVALSMSGSPQEEALGWSMILTIFFAPVVGVALYLFKLIKS